MQFQHYDWRNVAPMEGVTDFPMRVWLSLTGKTKSMASPFLRITEHYPPKNQIPKVFLPEMFLQHKLSWQDTTLQLMGSCPKRLAVVAKEALEHTDWFELNCGCPSPKVVGHQAGSALLRDPSGFENFLKTLTKEIGPQKLGVKMRLGVESPAEFDALISAAYKLPLKRLVVHGRTRQEGYRGKSRWDLIEKAAKLLPYPVYGSGDIICHDTFRSSLLTAPSVCGVLVGRGVLYNPWLFEDLSSGCKKGCAPELIFFSLLVYYHFIRIYLDSPETFFSFVEDGWFKNAYLKDVSLWKKLLAQLSKVPTTSCPKKRFVTLGRTKMLWNYLRNNLEDQSFARVLLRVKSIEDFESQYQDHFLCA